MEGDESEAELTRSEINGNRKGPHAEPDRGEPRHALRAGN